MKIIHCADIHLDARMTSNLDTVKAKERRLEILATFLRMIEWAEKEEVEAVMIVGDLFDTSNIYASTKNAIINAVTSHPNIIFYYLNGNHDVSNFIHTMEVIPDNLRLFSNQWTSYEQIGQDGSRVVFTGVELENTQGENIYDALVLNHEAYNIVMLHGQQNKYASKDKAEVIHLEALKNKGIDYLALGHVHEPSQGRLDNRAKWRYCGCLEGRGFDECGEHGFVLLECKNANEWEDIFIPFARRRLHTVTIDASGSQTSPEILTKINKGLKEEQIPSGDLVKVVLTGTVDVNCEKNIVYLVTQLKEQFYYIKIYDEMKLRVDYSDYVNDVSLKGEYVRLVMGETSLSEEEKAELVRAGIQALAGEALDE